MTVPLSELAAGALAIRGRAAAAGGPGVLACSDQLCAAVRDQLAALDVDVADPVAARALLAAAAIANSYAQQRITVAADPQGVYVQAVFAAAVSAAEQHQDREARR